MRCLVNVSSIRKRVDSAPCGHLMLQCFFLYFMVQQRSSTALPPEKESMIEVCETLMLI